MKKFFALLLVALFGAMSLFADDVTDIKALIVKQCELGAKGDFAGTLALFAPDYQDMGSSGITFNYEQTKWMILMLDGKHPEEFLLFSVMIKNNGVMPSADEIQKIRQVARNPEIIKQYKQLIPELVAIAKASAELELKTLKFDTVKLFGGQAVVIIKYNSRDDKSGKIEQKTEIVVLRKINNVWKIYRDVTL